MNSVIFGFSKPIKYNILSAMIQSVEKRPFSHAYIRFKEPVSGKDVIFQASGLSVNLCLFETFLLKEVPVEEYELPLKPDESMIFWDYVLSKLGIPYSLLQLVAILIHKVCRIELFHNGSDAEICSELAARTSEILGLPKIKDADYETPSDFQKFCVEHMQRVL